MFWGILVEELYPVWCAIQMVNFQQSPAQFCCVEPTVVTVFTHSLINFFKFPRQDINLKILNGHYLEPSQPQIHCDFQCQTKLEIQSSLGKLLVIVTNTLTWCLYQCASKYFDYLDCTPFCRRENTTHWKKGFRGISWWGQPSQHFKTVLL